MAKWTKNKVNPEQINNGNEYTVNDNVSIEELNGIVNNSFKAQEDAERALELATGANEANGTVVKINGEPQGTWDATIAQKISEESKNILCMLDYSTTRAGANFTTNKENQTLVINGTTTGSSENKIGSIEKITLKAGKTYTISAKIISGSSSSETFQILLYSTNRGLYSNPFGGAFNILRDNGKQYTPTEDIEFDALRVYVWSGITFTNCKIILQVEEGNSKSEIQPYNSASHITNGQADLLKSEWEKQVNLCKFDENVVLNGEEYQSGDIYFDVEDSDYPLCFSISVSYWTTANASGAFIEFKFDDESKEYIMGHPLNTTGTMIYSKVFNDGKKLSRIRIVNYSRSSGILNWIQLEKGTTFTSYQRWTGGNVTKKDIEPVLLWKNATPTSSFPAQTITMSEDMSKFKKIIIACRDNYSDNRIPLNFEFSNITFGEEKRGLLYSIENSNSQYWYSSRTFYFKTPTTLYFDKAYKNATGNISESLIDLLPFEIYGVNY